MIKKWYPAQISNMLNHHELLRHHYGTIFLKISNSKISKKKSHSRSMKCQPKANNNREAVAVSSRHVVKRPSKRMRASFQKVTNTSQLY